MASLNFATASKIGGKLLLRIVLRIVLRIAATRSLSGTALALEITNAFLTSTRLPETRRCELVELEAENSRLEQRTVNSKTFVTFL